MARERVLRLSDPDESYAIPATGGKSETDRSGERADHLTE